jgi:chemotaxis response regulator CheB
MKPNSLRRILLIIEDSPLALSLQAVLSEHGNIVRWEKDSTRAVKVVREFRPDAMLTASAFAVFISCRNSPDILHLPKPVDAVEVLHLLESHIGG